MIKKILKNVVLSKIIFNIVFFLKYHIILIPFFKKILLRYSFLLAANSYVVHSIIISRFILRSCNLSFKEIDSISTIFLLQGLSNSGMLLKLKAKKLRQDELIRRGLQNYNYRVFSSNLFAPIGHMGLIDIFIKGEKLGLIKKKTNILQGDSKNYICPSLFDYWKKILVDQNSTNKIPDEVENNLELFEANFEIFENSDGGYFKLDQFGSKVQKLWESQGRAALLTLSDEDIDYGCKILLKMGVPENAWFCGLHVRETPGGLRDVRNAEISTYYKFCKEITNRGGWVIRMGDATMQPIHLGGNFIDYVNSGYMSEKMNLFLWAMGLFFTGTGSGPANIPTCFGKPVLMTNVGPLLSRLWGSNIILMPKRYYSTMFERDLTVDERLHNNIGVIESTEGLKAHNIKVIDNTADELAEGAIEMIDSINSRTIYNEFESKIINNFKNLSAKKGIFPTRLSRSSLRHFKPL